MWEYFQNGGHLMIPLLACSVVSMAVILERAIFWIKCPNISNLDTLIKAMSTHESGKSIISKNLKTANLNDFEKKLLNSISDSKTKPVDAFIISTHDSIKEMSRGMLILSTIITLAPLLGILGTVVGIIESFNAIGATSQASPQIVSKGIAQALATTAGGLSIAIVTLVPFNYFQNRINQYCDSIDSISSTLRQ